MDVTPQVINEVEFHQKMRGYDPDEVDDFLERVAVAVEQLQQRVGQAEQRAIAAERRAGEIAERSKDAPRPTGAPANEAEETEAIRRTLVLAQRTADAAIKEAEEDAKRTMQSAQDQAQRLYAEAQEQTRKLVIGAESEARKAADETRQRLVKEIIALEETRDSLRADQGILERHLDEQRLRLRSSIGELQRLLDDPGRLRAVTPPELSGATRPELLDEPADDLDAQTAQQDDGPVADTGGDEADDEPVIDLDEAAPPVAKNSAVERPITGRVTFTPPDDGEGEHEGDEWVRFARGELDGPPTMAVRAGDSGDDAYLTELRKAMLDDTSASTLDPDEHRTRTRFGRRR
ncbi:MAG: cell division initiation protein [Acidimicrobiaceae bacterium]|jgi:DivIVA domain-containing protein